MNTLKKLKVSLDVLCILFMIGQGVFVYFIHSHYAIVHIPTHFTFVGEADAFGSVMDLHV